MQSNKYCWVIASFDYFNKVNIFGKTYYLYIFMLTPSKLLIRIKFSPISIFKSYLSLTRRALSLDPPILIHKCVDYVRLIWIISIACLTPLESL